MRYAEELDCFNRVLFGLEEETHTVKDRVGKFFVVTKPYPESELQDILFETDVRGLILQAKGGLSPDEIVAVFPERERKAAKMFALGLLSKHEEPEERISSQGVKLYKTKFKGKDTWVSVPDEQEEATEKTIDWEALEQKARDMTDEQLRYAVQDAREAARSMRGWNPEREGYYDDEVSVYAKELRRRGVK